MTDQTLFDMTPDRLRVRPAFARKTDPETSHEAAASVDRIRESQHHILELFKQHGPMSDTELAARIHKIGSAGLGPSMSPSGIRTRRSELVKLGKLKDSGQTTLTASGRKTIIWTAC